MYKLPVHRLPAHLVQIRSKLYSYSWFSELIVPQLAHLACEPCFDCAPFAPNLGGRQTRDLRRLFQRESCEETQLDDATPPRIDGCQPREQLVNRDQLAGPCPREDCGLFQRDPFKRSTSFQGSVPAGV